MDETLKIQKRKILIGLLFQIPILIAATIGIYKLASMFFLSFTDYNGISSPKFIGISNYLNIFREEVVLRSIGNTIRYVLVVGILLIIAAVIPALLTAKLKSPFGIGILFGYTIISLSSIFGVNWSYIFSGDSYSYLNSMLLSLNIITEPIQWINVFSFEISAIIMFMVSLAPIYGITYLFAKINRGAIGCAVAIGAIPIILTFCSSYATGVVGYPTTDYSADWLPLVMSDYLSVRYEIGFAYAIQNIGILMFLIWCAVWVPMILVVGKFVPFSKIPKKISVILGLVAFGLSLIMIFGLLLLVLNRVMLAFKPLDELFSFPPSFFVKRPTLVNFKAIPSIIGLTGSTILYNLLSVIILVAIAFVTTVPSGVGLAISGKFKLKWLLFVPLLALVFLSPSFGYVPTAFKTRTGYMLSGIAIAFMIYIVYLVTKFIIAASKKKAVKIILGILTVFSWIITVCTWVALLCPYSTFGDNKNSIYIITRYITAGGIARVGVASAVELILIIFVLGTLIIPMVLSVLIYILHKKEK